MEWQAMQETPSSSKGRALNDGFLVSAPEKSAAVLLARLAVAREGDVLWR